MKDISVIIAKTIVQINQISKYHGIISMVMGPNISDQGTQPLGSIDHCYLVRYLHKLLNLLLLCDASMYIVRKTKETVMLGEKHKLEFF
jgi:hypothetical protein